MFVQARPDAFDFVHLPPHQRFVRVGGDQPRELGLLLVQLLPLLTQECNRGLENAVDTAGLIACEAQVPLELRVAPPGKAERLCATFRGQHQ